MLYTGMAKDWNIGRNSYGTADWLVPDRQRPQIGIVRYCEVASPWRGLECLDLMNGEDEARCILEG